MKDKENKIMEVENELNSYKKVLFYNYKDIIPKLKLDNQKYADDNDDLNNV